MDLAEDARWIRETLKGSEESFRRLVEKYQERAVWAAYGMVGDHEAARDIAQEAFFRAYRALARFDRKRKFYTWFYQIVMNLCTDHFRRRGVRPARSLETAAEPMDTRRSPEEEADAAETRERVLEVLQTVPALYRQALVLSDLEGMTSQQMAKVAGSTPGTMRWRLFEARKMFREAWKRKRGLLARLSR